MFLQPIEEEKEELELLSCEALPETTGFYLNIND